MMNNSQETAIENVVQKMHEAWNILNEHGNLRLGQLIDTLRQVDTSKHLFFENIDSSGKGYDELKQIYPDLYWDSYTDPHRSGVGHIHSWRGVYSQLALEPSKEIRTVSDTFAELQDTMGRKLEGYKGGDFLMAEDTLVWCSEYGKSSAWSRTEIYEFEDGDIQPKSVNLAIKGVVERETEVVILYEEVETG